MYVLSMNCLAKYMCLFYVFPLSGGIIRVLIWKLLQFTFVTLTKYLRKVSFIKKNSLFCSQLWSLKVQAAWQDINIPLAASSCGRCNGGSPWRRKK